MIFSKACLYLGLFVFLGLAGAPFRSDGKVPLRSGAPGLQFLPRVGVFNIIFFIVDDKNVSKICFFEEIS